MSDQLDRPTTNADDPMSLELWAEYWTKQNQPWRCMPEIDSDRQRFLRQREELEMDTRDGLPDSSLEDGTYDELVEEVTAFKGIKLCRGDVEWLIVHHINRHSYYSNVAGLPNPLDLEYADLSGESLGAIPLDHCCLKGVNLSHANLYGTHLEGTDLSFARLEGANLQEASLMDANLFNAHLKRAILVSAHLEGAILTAAHLEAANLRSAHLERTLLNNAHLGGADLRSAICDAETNLEHAVLSDQQYGSLLLAGVQWGGANLTRVDWRELDVLGDDQLARQSKPSTREDPFHLRVYEMAVQANRQLATTLRDQGMNEDASRFAYRAQRLQQHLLWLETGIPQRHWWSRVVRLVSWMLWPIASLIGLASRVVKQLRWLPHFMVGARKLCTYGVWLLMDALAGHGYKPGRTLFWYLFVIASFTEVYHAHGLSVLQALILSVTAFHGRGFFLGNGTLSDLAMWAAGEAVVGLFIEISFIASFTLRYFGR